MQHHVQPVPAQTLLDRSPIDSSLVHAAEIGQLEELTQIDFAQVKASTMMNLSMEDVMQNAVGGIWHKIGAPIGTHAVRGVANLGRREDIFLVDKFDVQIDGGRICLAREFSDGVVSGWKTDARAIAKPMKCGDRPMALILRHDDIDIGHHARTDAGSTFMQRHKNALEQKRLKSEPIERAYQFDRLTTDRSIALPVRRADVLDIIQNVVGNPRAMRD
jgi:hypothetical protein